MADLDLRLADCLDPVSGLASLPDESVDVVLTDPPYSKHTHEKQRTGAAMPDAEASALASRRKDRSLRTGAACLSRYRDLGFHALTREDQLAFAVQYSRLARRWVLVFSDDEGVGGWIDALIGAGLQHVRVGHWHKLGSTPQFTGDRPAVGSEAIVIAHPPGRKRWNGGGKHGIWTHPIVLDRHGGSEPRVHPTQKPLALMLDLVRDFTEPGELILDSHAGSGTTGVACALLGRRFLGWERDEKHAAMARVRLAAAQDNRIDVDQRQIGLFATPDTPRAGAVPPTPRASPPGGEEEPRCA